MNGATLIDVNTAALAINQGLALAFDCRFDLSNPEQGKKAYQQGHLPQAQYADLNHDLSDLSVIGQGRHPLPTEAALSQTFERWGITPEHRVIVYDDGSGAFAARLWWLLKLCGHSQVMLLDGGLNAWCQADLPITTTIPDITRSIYPVRFNRETIATIDDVLHNLNDPSYLLIDARAAPRYRGEVEPIDPIAGHVPGARNRPFSDNLTSDGRFKSKDILHTEFSQLLEGRDPKNVLHMCGSGVTACHNLLAMTHAGLFGSRIYAASWSGWIYDQTRPVVTGAN